MFRRSDFVSVILIGFLSALVASEVVAFVTAGSNDQFAFLLWTVPFGLGVAVAACSLNRFLAQLATFLRLVIALFSGALMGVAWAVVTSLILGPQVGMFSMPYGLCWGAGGASAGATVALFSNAPMSRAIPGAIISAISLAAVVSFGVPLLVDIAVQNRTVTIVCVEYRQSDNRLTIEDDSPFGRSSLAPSDIAAVKKHYPTGLLKVSRTHTSGRGPSIKLVFVMHQPAGDTQQFKLPEQGSVMFIQTKSGWHQEPHEYSLLDRSIEIRDTRYKWQGKQNLHTSYEIENADGSRTGGILLLWPVESNN